MFTRATTARCLTLTLLMLIQPLAPALAAGSDGSGSTIEPNIDLDSLRAIGVEPIGDAEHGWGEKEEGSVVAHLRHRDSILVQQRDWRSSFGNGALDGWMILAHEAPVPTEWKGELRSVGIECRSFIPPQSFHCLLSGHRSTELADSGVIAMARFDPIDRMHEWTAAALLGEYEARLHERGRGVFTLVLSGEEAPDLYGAPLGSVSILSHDDRFISVDATTRGIAHLSTLDEVEFIEPSFERRTFNDVGREVMEVDWVESTSNMQGLDSSWNGLDGSGITVTVADTGLDNGVNNSNMHPDLRDHITGIVSYSMSQGNHNYCGGNANDGASDIDGHGTHVAGSVLGDGTDSGGSIIGSATEAHLVFQAVDIYCNRDGKSYLIGFPSNLSHMYDDAVANGSRVHTNSWGSDVAGQYTSTSMQADIGARVHRNLTVLFAAANEGADGNQDGEIDLDSLGAPATAKNVLTVGASENGRTVLCQGDGSCYYPGSWGSEYAEPIRSDDNTGHPEGMAAFSSRGPTDDQRLKPEVSAPGTFILSTKSRSTSDTGWLAYNSSYTYMGGTSMATPLTAGATALLLEHLIENENHTDPSSALVKAIFTAGASDMAGQYSSSTNGAGEDAPNDHEGWGRVNMSTMMNGSWIEGETVSTNEERAFRFTVPSGTSDLRVVLSWTDPESTPSVSNHLVNDLDLHLKAPDGTWTNVSNDRDNLVGEILSNPSSGTWEVHVVGTSVAVGPQHFALALSRSLAMTNISADADGDGFIDGADDCPSISGTSTIDRAGCTDSDGDGRSNPDSGWTVNDGADAFANDATQWADADFDGFGDNPTGSDSDDCTATVGTSTIDRQGCPDSDSDGWSDVDAVWSTSDGADSCGSTAGNSSEDRNGCIDSDDDGWSDADGGWTVSDGADAFPTDSSQYIDSDGDGFGDNSSGNSPDGCPTVTGDSTHPILGCADSDSDGWADDHDVLPNDDSQWNDTDGDGYGDNSSGTDADDCPTISGTSTQNGTLGCLDGDGDGWADDQDHFPNEGTQHADSDGDGFGDNDTGVDGDDCPSVVGNSSVDRSGCVDSDGDGRSNSDTNWTTSDGADALPNEPTQWADADGDGFGDNAAGAQGDACPTTVGNSTLDRFGCVDSDGDGQSDANDAFISDSSEWADTDGDSIGDNSDACPTISSTGWDANQDGCIDDGDGDGIGNDIDSCPTENSSGWDQDADGCIDDSDGDGVTDPNDDFPNDANETTDGDGDGVGDGSDDFPNDASQSADTDGDGYGDSPTGTQPDSCPTEAGNSTIGAFGCPDSDGDGVRDSDDALPNDPGHSSDVDGDGVGDSADACPAHSGTSTADRIGCPDTDGDGRSDPSASWTVADGADAFPGDETQWMDSDADGYGDNTTGNSADDCLSTPGTSFHDKRGCADGDGDGWSNDADAFDDDASQWNDSDGDGYGDNPNGFSPDYCPSTAGNSSADVLGCLDTDADGWSDAGDFLPMDATQHSDSDFDGFGDDPLGTMGDDCPDEHGSSTEGEVLGCADSDSDGYADSQDSFPNEPTQWTDADGDGYGDNTAPGAVDPDRWPDDSERNQAEITMTCSPDSIAENISDSGEFEVTCTLTNPGDVPLTITVEWTVPKGVIAPISVQTVELGAAGTEGATSTVIFTGRVTSAEPGELDTTISARDAGSDEPAAVESSTMLLIDPDAIEADVLLEYGLPAAIGLVSLITMGLLVVGMMRRGAAKEESELRLQRKMKQNTRTSYEGMMTPQRQRSGPASPPPEARAQPHGKGRGAPMMPAPPRGSGAQSMAPVGKSRGGGMR